MLRVFLALARVRAKRVIALFLAVAHPAVAQVVAQGDRCVPLPNTREAMEQERPMYEAMAKLPGEARKFLTRINLYRIENGKPPLRLSPLLTQSAQGMAEDMRARNWNPPSDNDPKCRQTPKPRECTDLYWHADSQMRLPLQRNEAVGYISSAHGENLAAGYRDADAVFEGWRTSTGEDGKGGHNAIMLRDSFCMIGIAVVYPKDSGEPGPYWVTDFGDIRDQDIFRPQRQPGGAILVDEIRGSANKPN